MPSSPPVENRVPEPLVGFAGDMGGAHGEKSIFKASEMRFGADLILSLLARGSAAIVLIMLVTLVGVLIVGAYPSIKTFKSSFVTSAKWSGATEETVKDASGNPVVDETGNEVTITHPPEFGALAFIYGTSVSSALALLFAVPLSLGAALFLVRIGPWLTPTFVKCGIMGLIFAGLLVLLGSHWNAFASTVGGIIGMAATIALLWIARTTEDPRVGPNPRMQLFLHVGVPVVLLLLMRAADVDWIWSFIWAAAAAAWLGQLGRAGVNLLSFMIEFLAAIPSIAYGLWGLFVLVPFLGHVEQPINSFLGWVPFLRPLHTNGMPTGRDMFAAGTILAIMILPIITAISRDVLRAVPQIQIEGTQALGATWWQSSWAMLRYGRSGLFGAIMLGLARAAGETMAVTMVIGNDNHIRLPLFEAGQTLSSLLANEFKESTDSLKIAALIELGLVLLVMSLTFNVIARYLVVGKQSRAGGA